MKFLSSNDRLFSFLKPLKALRASRAFGPLAAFADWMGLSFQDLLLMTLGNVTMAFTIFNVHVPARITEGGVLGGIVLVNKIFGLDPALVNLILNFILYFLGIFLLEKGFLKKAIYSTLIYSLTWKICDFTGPVLPSLAGLPFLAAMVGGLLLGAGCGLVVTRGGSSGGDDCLVMILDHYTFLSLSSAYFLCDLVVLILSFMVYLPVQNLFCSLLTTLISSFVVGRFESPLPKKARAGKEPGLMDPALDQNFERLT